MKHYLNAHEVKILYQPYGENFNIICCKERLHILAVCRALLLYKKNPKTKTLLIYDNKYFKPKLWKFMNEIVDNNLHIENSDNIGNLVVDYVNRFFGDVEDFSDYIIISDDLKIDQKVFDQLELKKNVHFEIISSYKVDRTFENIYRLDLRN